MELACTILRRGLETSLRLTSLPLLLLPSLSEELETEMVIAGRTSAADFSVIFHRLMPCHSLVRLQVRALFVFSFILYMYKSLCFPACLSFFPLLFLSCFRLDVVFLVYIWVYSVVCMCMYLCVCLLRRGVKAISIHADFSALFVPLQHRDLALSDLFTPLHAFQAGVCQ
mmetsp:Transcript_1660/g.3421  ORF Transcript_1660/g.3421 Transcript_1660/m.3421 type:complete len:170 (-) Transcript_1660:27-536(-)